MRAQAPRRASALDGGFGSAGLPSAGPEGVERVHTPLIAKQSSPDAIWMARQIKLHSGNQEPGPAGTGVLEGRTSMLRSVMLSERKVSIPAVHTESASVGRRRWRTDKASTHRLC